MGSEHRGEDDKTRKWWQNPVWISAVFAGGSGLVTAIAGLISVLDGSGLA